MTIHVILTAAGSGVRFGQSVKKQFLQLEGKPLFAHALDFFEHDARVTQIVLVLPADRPDMAAVSAKTRIVEGGDSRADSVRKGLMALESVSAADWVAVHDAARPLLSQTLWENLLLKMQAVPAVIPALAVSDTLKIVDADRVVQTQNRANLRAAQTPQIAIYQNLLTAYAKCAVPLEQITDEAMLLENCGFPVFLVEGEKRNIKITTPEDLRLAEFFLKQR